MLVCVFFAVAVQFLVSYESCGSFIGASAGACDGGESNGGGSGAKLTFGDAVGELGLLSFIEEAGLAIFAPFILFGFSPALVVATVRELSTVKVIDGPNGRSIALNFLRHHLIILYCALALRPRAWA